MAKVDLETLRPFVGQEFDTSEFPVAEAEILAFADAAGETDPRYSDPSHADFQAPPTFVAKYTSSRILPQAFPSIDGGTFDGGKTVYVHGPIRPGDVVRARSYLAEIYEKTGRSGQMIFIVHRMEFRNQKDELCAVVDWRMVRQPARDA